MLLIIRLKAWYTWRYAAYNRAKRLIELCEMLEEVISHRPLWTCVTVVMNMRIDRYEHVHRPLRDDIEAVFAWFSPCFRQTLTLFSPNTHLVFVKHSPCFRHIISLFLIKRGVFLVFFLRALFAVKIQIMCFLIWLTLFNFVSLQTLWR